MPRSRAVSAKRLLALIVHRGLEHLPEYGIGQSLLLAPGAYEHLRGVRVDVGHLAVWQRHTPLLELILGVHIGAHHEKEEVGAAQVREDAVGGGCCRDLAQ